MKKRLIVANERIVKRCYNYLSYQSFGSLKISEVIGYDEIVFVVEETVVESEINSINIVAGTKVDVFVVCHDLDCCMDSFKEVLNMNNSKRDIQFLPGIPEIPKKL
ncbi:MAG TPA: hypothetical protein P5060_01045 [Candidatus Absconditabacterales bacterium]|nr:hypothetical protein [Candidatus Absconditabacterales bacterium]